MSKSLINKIHWGLDDLEDYAIELENKESKKDMESIIKLIRDLLNEIESEIDDINECLKRINYYR